MDEHLLLDPNLIVFAVIDGTGHIRFMSNDEMECNNNIVKRGWADEVGKTVTVQTMALKKLKKVVRFEEVNQW